jgi:hypothetical protein
MATPQSPPQIGDLVELDGQQRVVTDICKGSYILRPVRGIYAETAVNDPDTLAILARNGTWVQ